MFCIFEKKKNSKWPPFLASEIFAETWKAGLHRYSVGQKFWPKSLYLKILCFAFLKKNAKNSKWPPFLAGQNFFEIALSHIVSEIQAFLCFALLKKIRKFKMATIFGK